MRVVRHFHHCPEEAKNSVVALGNFDGVHKGHQAVIKNALHIARNTGHPAAIMTFEPHPVEVLGNAAPPFRLGSFRSKAEQLQSIGIDVLFVQHFDKEFCKLSAERFIKDILVEQLAVSHVVIGHDFIFGHKRQGNKTLLEEKAHQYGFGFTQCQPLKDQEIVCSSTKIRQYLHYGDVKQAAKMLGRPHSISGRVIAGDKRGRTIGYPTANIVLKHCIRPKFGVYAVQVKIAGSAELYRGVANIGCRPTFDSHGDLLEVHLFDYQGDLYGKRLQVELMAFLREEKAFDNIASLKTQIDQDANHARTLLQIG